MQSVHLQSAQVPLPTTSAAVVRPRTSRPSLHLSQLRHEVVEHSTQPGQQHQPCQARRGLRTICLAAPGQNGASGSGTSSTKVVMQLPGSKLQLIHPMEPTVPTDKVMVFLPGTDGTGQAILPHVPQLHAQGGYDVYCLYMPPEDLSGWEELTKGLSNLLVALLAQLRQDQGRPVSKVTLFGESFGGVLALRLCAAAAGLVDEVILLNPATCFNDSLAGLSSVISSTNLLGLFPPPLYKVAQATLLPFLVDSKRISHDGLDRMRAMIDMLPATGSAPGSGAQPHQEVQMSAGTPADQPWPGLALPDGLSPSLTAIAANHRANLLRDGGRIPDTVLASVRVPVLLLSSARDRLLPSVQEGARLQRVLPQARRVILPDSGHAALLEDNINLVSLIRAPASRGRRADAHRGSSSMTAAQSAAQQGPVSAGDEPARAAGTSSQQQTIASNSTTTNSTRGSPDGQEVEVDGVQISSWDEWGQILAPWRDLVSPVLLGFENLPEPGSELADRPMLFVGNHQRIGFYDTPLLVYELAVRGYRVRGLAHPGHWAGPVGPFFDKFGAVRASPMAAFKLLKNKEKVLLFPGGAKEVSKPKGTEYQLFWKEEPDFVRLAAKCGALIVPFAAVGADDAYDVIMDGNEVLDHPVLGPVTKALYTRFAPSIDVNEAVLPLTKLPGTSLPALIPIPNLNRLYFKIAPPIDTTQLNLNLKDTAAVADLYAGVRSTVQQSITELLEYRARDEEDQVGARLSKAVSSWAALVVDTATRGPSGTSTAPPTQ